MIATRRTTFKTLLACCTLAGVAGAAAFAYWDFALRFFYAFDSLKTNIVAGFLIGFALVGLPTLLFILLRRIYVWRRWTNMSRADRERLIAATKAATSERNLQQLNDYEHEARDSLQKLRLSSLPPIDRNAETRLKSLKKAREELKIQVDDDPIALAEAIERFDVQISELEHYIASTTERVTTIDLPTLDEAIKRHPRNAALYFERGNYYLNTAKDSYKALAEYKRSIILLPGYPAAHYALGMAYLDRNQYAKAAEHFREAIRHDPDFSLARERLAAIESNALKPPVG